MTKPVVYPTGLAYPPSVASDSQTPDLWTIGLCANLDDLGRYRGEVVANDEVELPGPLTTPTIVAAADRGSDCQ